MTQLDENTEHVIIWPDYITVVTENNAILISNTLRLLRKLPKQGELLKLKTNGDQP